jgi:hypothetical protein
LTPRTIRVACLIQLQYPDTRWPNFVKMLAYDIGPSDAQSLLPSVFTKRVEHWNTDSHRQLMYRRNRLIITSKLFSTSATVDADYARLSDESLLVIGTLLTELAVVDYYTLFSNV